MKRICVIDVAGLSPRLLDTTGQHPWLDQLPLSARPAKPVSPALRAVVQASMTTGKQPGEHGVVAGGVYRRQAGALSLEERSNSLLTKKRFWHAKALPARPKVALVFWANPLAGAADWVLGATSYDSHHANISEQPVDMYAEVTEEIGQANLDEFQGPGASWRCSEWIASAARVIWKTRKPDLMWVYLPGIDFELVRHGVESDEAKLAVRQLDRICATLHEAVVGDDGVTVVCSDGGYVNVSQVGHPNRLLREAGLLAARDTESGELIDFQATEAFALTDHQVAHLYCRTEDVADKAAEILSADPAIESVVPRQEVFCSGMGHDRAGERVIFARADAWLDYRWWPVDQRPPVFAEHPGVPGRLGYDPCELLPGGDGRRLDLDLSHVKASRGRVDDDPRDWCLLAASQSIALTDQPVVTDLPQLLQGVMFQ